MDNVTTDRKIHTLPNHKPWMNKAVINLLRVCDAAFWSGDKKAYRTARAKRRRGIKEVKRCYKKCIEEHFNNTDSQCMWQGIKTITDYASNNTSSTQNTVSSPLPEELSQVFARFDFVNTSSTTTWTQQGPPIKCAGVESP